VNQPIPVAYATPANLLKNTVTYGNECALQAKILAAPCSPTILLQAPATFSSDSVWNYEIGEKSSFLDRRLIANVSAYYERWINPQLATNLAGFGITANGANARVVGVEAELQGLADPGVGPRTQLWLHRFDVHAEQRHHGIPQWILGPGHTEGHGFGDAAMEAAAHGPRCAERIARG